MKMNEIEEKANTIIEDRRKKVFFPVSITLMLIFILIIRILRLDKIDNSSSLPLIILVILFVFFYANDTIQNFISDIFLLKDEEYQLSKKIIKDYNRKAKEIKKKEKEEKRKKEQERLKREKEDRKREQEKFKKEEEEREELLNKIKIERSLFEAKRKSQSIQELKQYITDNIEKE